MVFNQSDVVAIYCRCSGERILVVTCYCSPSKDIDVLLLPLATVLNKYSNDNVVLVGDYNAKSVIWGERLTDPRGRDLITFASNANIEIVNDQDSMSSFSGRQREDWIDILIVRYCAYLDSLSDYRVMIWIC